MITYQEETWEKCIPEFKPLFEKHWEEIALHKDKVKLSPMYDTYLTLESVGCLHTVTARDQGVLIGYYVSFIQPHMHYSECLTAVNDILFIAPEYRKGRTGIKLFKKAEELLKDKGVDLMIISSKVKQDFKPIMDLLGFERVEYNYSKYIGTN